MTGKKYLNENIISLDLRLLKNFYLNKGFYNIKLILLAKLINQNEFELVYNVRAGNRFYFNNLNLKLPDDFDEQNFKSINKLFKKLKGEPYSINQGKDFGEVEKITILEQFQSISANVNEDIIDQKINLEFVINQTEAFVVEKINIFGNNVTRENVIRNQFEIDEGDPYNEILANKSINNLKSLNFFKNVSSETVQGSSVDSKVININIEESNR